MRYQESLAYESRGRIRSRIAAGEGVRTEHRYCSALELAIDPRRGAAGEGVRTEHRYCSALELAIDPRRGAAGKGHGTGTEIKGDGVLSKWPHRALFSGALMHWFLSRIGRCCCHCSLLFRIDGRPASASGSNVIEPDSENS